MFWISYIIIFLLVGIDQLTKLIAENNLIYLESKEIIPHFLNFRLTYNTGAAWSMLSDHHWILVVISLIASCVLLFICTKNKFDNKKNIFYSITISLITAGTIGNLIDRAFYEKGVIDFIELGFMDFPIFNIADSFITIGMIMLCIYILFIYKEPVKEDKKDE